MNGRATITFERPREVLTLPVSTFFIDRVDVHQENVPIYYFRVSDGRARATSLERGESRKTAVEVPEGLGDESIIRYLAKDGRILNLPRYEVLQILLKEPRVEVVDLPEPPLPIQVEGHR